jgi:hypothetical protein
MVSPVVSISVAEMVATVVPVVALSAIILVLSWILLGVMSLISVTIKMAQDVDLGTKSSYSISITVSDGVNASTAMDFSLSVSQLVITSSTTVIATENTEKEINLTTNL